MADKKISELTAASALTGTESVEVVQGGVNKKTTTQEIADLGGGGVTDGDKGDVVVSISGTVWTVESASESQAGKIELATQAETNTGTDDARAVTPLKLKTFVNANAPKVLVIACSDEVTPITAATNKVKFRMPYAMTVTAVRASLSTTQTSGSIFTVDINEGGTTILSTKLTIDNGEVTSTTAATPAVISDASLADDAEITIDVDQVGDNTAKGLKVTLIGS